MAAANATAEMSVFDDPIFYLYLVSQSMAAFSLPCQLSLLYQIWKNRIDDLSANLLIHIIVWCVFMSNGLILGSYMMINLMSKEKNAYYIFFAGGLHVAFGQAIGVAVTFLCLDRSFALLAPMSYKRYRKPFITTTIAACVFVPSINIVAMLILEYPNLKPTTACKSMSCLLTNGSAMVIYFNKIVCGCVSIFFSIVFVITLCKHIESGSTNDTSKAQFKRANTVVGAATLSELIFMTIPYMFSVIAGYLKISIAGLGPFISVSGSMDSIITAISYRILIMRRLNKNTVTAVQTMTSD